MIPCSKLKDLLERYGAVLEDEEPCSRKKGLYSEHEDTLLEGEEIEEKYWQLEEEGCRIQIHDSKGAELAQGYSTDGLLVRAVPDSYHSRN